MAEGWKLAMVSRLAEIEDMVAEMKRRLIEVEKGEIPLQVAGTGRESLFCFRTGFRRCKLKRIARLRPVPGWRETMPPTQPAVNHESARETCARMARIRRSVRPRNRLWQVLIFWWSRSIMPTGQNLVSRVQDVYRIAASRGEQRTHMGNPGE